MARETPADDCTPPSMAAPGGERGNAMHGTGQEIRCATDGRQLLWLFALGMGACNLLFQWLLQQHSELSRRDFSAFWVAGKLFDAGRAHQLYNIAAQAQLHLYAPYRQVPLPFIHAPYEAALFALLALLPYQASYVVWSLVNLALLTLMAWRLQPRLAPLCDRAVPLILLLSLAYWPNAMVLFQGQDSILVAVLLVEAFVQLKQGRDGRAGVILALGMFKFHLLLPLVACLAMNRQWRVLKSFAAVACCVGALCVAMVGIGGVHQYLELLPQLSRMPLARYIRAEEMPNLRGLLSTLLTGTPRLIGISILAACAAVCGAVAWSLPGQDRGRRFDLFFACATAGSYALSFHSYEHDMAAMFPGLMLAGSAVAHVGSWRLRMACLGTMALLWFSPLYIFLSYHNVLCLMCLPVVTYIGLIAIIAGKTA
ncbi:MAG: glycosyltransferase family 87 protein [Candidatus Korobacteraceae bacterium]